MIVKNCIKTLALAMLVTASSALEATGETLKREFRSTWISTVWGLDWPSTVAKGGAGTGTTTTVINNQKKLLTDYLDKMAAANMTGVCFQVRARADAFYKSNYAPWSSDISGTRGKDPGWDPLAFAVEEAHARGLELYAWINPYRWTTGSDWSTSYDKTWINNKWIITHTSSEATSKYLNPGIKGVHDLIINVVNEIVTGYAVDGLIIDDYFYPNGIVTNSSASDYSTYTSSGTSLSIADWRRENVNTLVADIHKKIMDVRPDVRFGIGPPGVAGKSASKYGLPSIESYGIKSGDWQYDGQFTDPLQWMFSGNIDFISPQIYWKTTHSTAPYGPITNWWSNAAKKANRHHYSSMSITALASGNTESAWAEYAQEVQLNRDYTQNNAPGYNLFRTAFISGPEQSGLGNYLVANKSGNKVLQPQVTWKDEYAHTYAAPENPYLQNGTLRWSAVTDGNRIIKYSVYAVPSTLTKAQAKDANGDGIKADYLLGITYTNSYTLPSNRKSGYWYAVCVYDGFSREHEAGYINYVNQEKAPATTLVSPANGSEVQGKFTLTWNAVDVDYYTVDIATDNAFKKIVKTKPDLTKTSTNISAGALDKGTYYWRVITKKAEYEPAVSSVWSFTVSLPAATATTLVAPEDGAKIDGDLTLEWQSVNADSYTIEIASDAAFTTIKKTITDVTAQMYILSSGQLKKGTYYWRVIANKAGYDPATSEVRSFKITSTAVGLTEPGYTVKTENYTYPNIGQYAFQNIWIRNVDRGNFSQENNGQLNRGFVVREDGIYISGRREASSQSELYLAHYDRLTGEHIADITLNGGQCSYFPCNDVIKDSQDNLIITNLSLNISTTPLKIYKVNPENGNVYCHAELTYSGAGRVDHAAVVGDVTGDFYVFAAIASSNKVVRWTVTKSANNSQAQDGNTIKKAQSVSKTEVCTLGKFFPSASTDLGIAPVVIPIDKDHFYVNGSKTAMTPYTFSAGKTVNPDDSFTNAPTAVKNDWPDSGSTPNGGSYLTYENIPLMVVPREDHSGSDGGYQWELFKTNSKYNYNSMESQTSFPIEGLGTVNSTTFQAQTDYYIDKSETPSTGYVYAYAPGNGIAGYKLYSTSGNTSVDTPAAAEIGYTIFGRQICLTEIAESIALYAPDGTLIASAENEGGMACQAPAGIYILRIVYKGRIITEKVVLH